MIVGVKPPPSFPENGISPCKQAKLRKDMQHSAHAPKF